MNITHSRSSFVVGKKKGNKNNKLFKRKINNNTDLFQEKIKTEEGEFLLCELFSHAGNACLVVSRVVLKLITLNGTICQYAEGLSTKELRKL